MQPNIQLPDSEPARLDGEAMVLRTKSLAISNQSELDVACGQLQAVATRIKAIKAEFLAPKADANKLHKWVCEVETRALDSWNKASNILRDAIGRYEVEAARQRRIEQARREAEALEQQKAAVVDEAIALEAAGDSRAAEAVMAEPVMAPVIEIARPATPGISARKGYEFRVVDPTLVKRDFLMLDEQKIRKTVNALGLDAAKLVGGIEVTERAIVAVRTS